MRIKIIYISMLMLMSTLFIACEREKPRVEAEIYSITESELSTMDLSDDVSINSTEETVTTIDNSDVETEETNIEETNIGKKNNSEKKNKQNKKLDTETAGDNEEKPKSTEGDNKTGTISGTVESIGDGKAVINKATISGSNNEIMTSSNASKQLANIFFNSETEFVICSSSDGGITSNYTPATLDSLSTNMLIEASGTYDGVDLIASKITMFNFQ